MTDQIAQQPVGPNYNAPALDKGLDILELLANESHGLSQKMVASRLNRTAAEIFRMLLCLEKRGYISRSVHDDLYRLTPRLLELGHRHPPTQTLIERATPPMHAYAATSGESCHLVILHDQDIQVIAQSDAPGFVGFAVRVGTRHVASKSTSGQLLLACRAGTLPEDPFRCEVTASPYVDGILDICCLITGSTGKVVAALTTPFPRKRKLAQPIEKVSTMLSETAKKISEALKDL